LNKYRAFLKNHFARKYFRATVPSVFISLLLSVPGALAQTVKVDTFATSQNKQVTLDSLNEVDQYEGKVDFDFINIFHKFVWQVRLMQNNKEVNQFATQRPDTLNLEKASSVNLSTQFFVNPKLRGKTIALSYSFSGEVLVLANGDTIFSAGSFNKSKDKKLHAAEQKGFSNFPLSDSVQYLSITYIPDKRIHVFNLKMTFRDLALAEQRNEASLIDDHNDYALGFYYLSFAIVFMLVFLFSTEKTENLYFSRFACAVL
jgi:hypothetical protein